MSFLRWGCVLICPTKALTETRREIGCIEYGICHQIAMMTGILRIGESSGVPIIRAMLKKVKEYKQDLVVIDCPPGSACTVMASIEAADYCLLVVEPTVFGIHNFAMVYELVKLLKKPCGVVINKVIGETDALDDFCKRQNISVLCKIPYHEMTAWMGAKGQVAVEKDVILRSLFMNLLGEISKGVTPCSNC